MKTIKLIFILLLLTTLNCKSDDDNHNETPSTLYFLPSQINSQDGDINGYVSLEYDTHRRIQSLTLYNGSFNKHWEISYNAQNRVESAVYTLDDIHQGTLQFLYSPSNQLVQMQMVYMDGSIEPEATVQELNDGFILNAGAAEYQEYRFNSNNALIQYIDDFRAVTIELSTESGSFKDVVIPRELHLIFNHGPLFQMLYLNPQEVLSIEIDSFVLLEHTTLLQSGFGRDEFGNLINTEFIENVNPFFANLFRFDINYETFGE